MTAIIIGFAVVVPIGLPWWTARALSRWTGAWRAAALAPAALALAAIGLAVRSFQTDPMGHGGQLAIAVALWVLALLIAYAMSELYQAHVRRAANWSAPPNERGS